MSDHSDARSLRMERLESRSLLAGGVFDFAFDPGNVDSEQLLPLNQQVNVQGDSARPQEVAQNTPRPRTGAAQNASAQAASALAASALAASALAASQRIAAVPFQSTTPISLPSTPQSQAAPRQPISIDAAIAALVSESSSEVDSEFAHDLPTDEVSTIHSKASSQIVVTETLNAQQGNALGPSPNDSPSIAGDGYIDLAPLDPFESLTKDSEPWQLETRTIPLLKQVAERAIGEQFSGDRAALIDQLMHGWFGGPGGLIALEQIILPANQFALDAAIVDPGLQSTVALHRSLNLVAGSVIPALSGQVLDAIMASLEKVSASAVQPVIESSPVRVPTAIYPIAAVVVTTIAIAARRKQKHPQPNLQFTSGQ